MSDDLKYELQKIKDAIDSLERGKIFDIKEKFRDTNSALNDIKSRLEDIKNKLDK